MRSSVGSYGNREYHTLYLKLSSRNVKSLNLQFPIGTTVLISHQSILERKDDDTVLHFGHGGHSWHLLTICTLWSLKITEGIMNLFLHISEPIRWANTVRYRSRNSKWDSSPVNLSEPWTSASWNIDQHVLEHCHFIFVLIMMLATPAWLTVLA